MHPLISAYINWQQCHDLNIRFQSWYFGQWQQMCAERRNWLNEVYLHEVGTTP